ncbi:MAG: hypothetical protein D6780_05120 [Candidatus Dadabacteria bacterium]|nr:MAG: hypothetical protein D6780_05120 [Candidatus Dadabacteria bacterium]
MRLSREKASPSFMPWHYSSLQQHLYAFLLLIAATLFLFKTQWITSHYLGGARQDAGYYVWLTKVVPKALLNKGWFNLPANYPYTRTLAWSDNFILPSLSTALLEKLGFSHTLSYNLVFLAAIFLNSFCTYYLLRKISGSFLFSLISAVFVLCNSAFFSFIGHPQMLYFFPAILSFTFLFYFFNNPSFIPAFLFTLFALIQFLTSVYWAVFTALFSSTFILFLAVCRPYFLSWKKVFLLLLSLTITAVISLPFVYPYLEVSQVFGDRKLFEQYYLSSNILSYFSAWPGSWLWQDTSYLGGSRGHFFTGITAVVLLTAAIVRIAFPVFLRLSGICWLVFFVFSAYGSFFYRKNWIWGASSSAFIWLWLLLYLFHLRKTAKLEEKLNCYILTDRDLTAIFLGIILFFIALSWGPMINPEKGHFAFSPAAFLYWTFPGFSALRALRRCALVAVLFTAFLIPFVLKTMFKRKNKLIALFVGALLVLENIPSVIPKEKLPPAPPLINNLSKDYFRDEVVLNLPFAPEINSKGEIKSFSRFAELVVNYLNWLSNKGGSLVNGYGGVLNRVIKEFPRSTANFPDEKSIKKITSIGTVSYIIYYGSLVDDFNRERFLKKLKDYDTWLELVASDAANTFLLKFHPIIFVNEDFEVRIPSYPQSKLSFELMSPPQEGIKSIKVAVFETDHKIKNFFFTKEIPADNSWHPVSLLLPKASYTALPFRVRFKSISAFYLRNLRVKKVK